MKTFQYILFTCICFCLTNSCKPDREEQKYMGTFPLGDIKDYLYFKPGSMWVYECDSTGELDTQVMVSCDTPWIIEPYIKYQELDRVIQSKNEGSQYNDTRIKGGFPYSKNYSYEWYITRWRYNVKNGGTGTDCIFYKPYDSSLLGGFGSSPSHYKGLLTNYTVAGNTYDTVRVFQVQISAGWPVTSNKFYETVNKYAKVDYFYAKGVGIIKLRVWSWNFIRNKPNTHNWNLKSYKVTQ